MTHRENEMAERFTHHEHPNASTADLLKNLSEQTTRLARQEVELAKAELSVKGKQAGAGAGMFGGAGVLGLYAGGALVGAAVAALSLAMGTWLAALIVGVVLAAAAAIVAMTGKKKVQQAMPPVPERSVESVKEDVQWTKTRAQEARR
jgi:Putative Actinobacterial Holin-X, holin superfamily III